MRQGFREELEQLRLQVELMGVRVDQNLERMRDMLATGDARLADTAMEADDEIDAMNVSLTERCYLLLGREAPVASDLRFIVSVLRVVSELERIGDLAPAGRQGGPKHDLLLRSDIVFDVLVTMADEALERYRMALRAWATMDLGLATELATSTRNMDVYYERLMAELVRLDGPDAVPIAMAAFAAGRSSSASATTPRSSAPGCATSSPATPTTSPPRCGRCRSPWPSSARRSTSSSTTSSATSCASAARVTESIPRGTQALLAATSARRRRSSTATTSSTALALDIEERCSPSSPSSSRWPATCAPSSPPSASTSEIERSGDLMVNVAKATRRLYGCRGPPRLRGRSCRR